MIDPLLLAAARVLTFNGTAPLTKASGFFYEREDSLFLVTSRHVFVDPATHHAPDRIEIELHTDADNLAQSTGFSIPLYADGGSLWRDARDAAGPVDVALIEIERAALPSTALYRAFAPANQVRDPSEVEIGATVMIIGFPLGFHDTLHHMPVARQAIVASAFGLRFQGNGYFLTDARTHRGISGAPVVMRREAPDPETDSLPWMLLGIHSGRLDMGGRDMVEDETLGLNCAWYADVLETLTAA